MSLRNFRFYHFAMVAMILSLSVGGFAQTRPNSRSNRQIQTLLQRIENKTVIFQRGILRQFDTNNSDGSYREEGMVSSITNFVNATEALQTSFDERRVTTAQVREVLQRAAYINSFMRENQLTPASQNQWNSLRTDLNTLANYYRVSWNWNNSSYPDNQNNGFDSRLTGTYRLNANQSDDVATTIERAIVNINYNDNQRERSQRNLERRLSSPQNLMIEKRGQQITLAASQMSQVTFNADGVARTETSTNGRAVTVRATSTSSDVTINYEGDRVNDYYVSFRPQNNGQLRIIRRIYLENRNETVTINSVYDKTDRNPRWDTTNYPNTTGNNNVNNFVIPNNTRLSSTLDTPLSTDTAKDADRFSLTVTSPSQYDGAIIEGRVIGEQSGVVSGRATLTLNFETIRLSNGSTYRFAGIVEQVRKPNGSNVNVNNEGTVRDSNQTTKTVTRTGIGAILGGIIGAIAGGGQGAAIGAGVGAGAGAGSVVLQGRDNLELPGGSEIIITATAPANVADIR